MICCKLGRLRWWIKNSLLATLLDKVMDLLHLTLQLMGRRTCWKRDCHLVPLIVVFLVIAMVFSRTNPLHPICLLLMLMPCFLV